jgi:GNAT superfamily N-acetyltransferase
MSQGDGRPITADAPTTFRALRIEDASLLHAAFAAIGWSKPEALFHGYLQDQAAGVRWVCVAERGGRIAGYVTVLWAAMDPVLRARGIPEIVDLNVLPGFRRRGIGRALLLKAEAEAALRSEQVGLRVGLHSGYGSAQRLYVREGYVPDGAGAIVDGEPVAEGARIYLDDAVTIRMIKQRGSPHGIASDAQPPSPRQPSRRSSAT